MNIILDTNVFVGACMGSGYANRIVESCLTGIHSPFMGMALLTEYEDVIRREDVFSRSRLNLSEREELLDKLSMATYILWLATKFTR